MAFPVTTWPYHLRRSEPMPMHDNWYQSGSTLGEPRHGDSGDDGGGVRVLVSGEFETTLKMWCQSSKETNRKIAASLEEMRTMVEDLKREIQKVGEKFRSELARPSNKVEPPKCKPTRKATPLVHRSAQRRRVTKLLKTKKLRRREATMVVSKKKKTNAEENKTIKKERVLTDGCSRRMTGSLAGEGDDGNRTVHIQPHTNRTFNVGLGEEWRLGCCLGFGYGGGFKRGSFRGGGGDSWVGGRCEGGGGCLGLQEVEDRKEGKGLRVLGLTQKFEEGGKGLFRVGQGWCLEVQELETG